MLACYAWSNLQIINITNAIVNLYPGEKADLYIRMGPHISECLISTIEKSGVFCHVHCIDPLTIDTRKTSLGGLPKLRILALKKATTNAYNALLERLCADTVYDRVLLPWFFADSVFLINYWSKFNKDLAITFVEEGTSSYCYTQKQMCFSLFNAPSLKAKLKRYLTEGALMRNFTKKVDTLCLYRPEFSRPDITFNKLALPVITVQSNPIMYSILLGAAGNVDYIHFSRYEKSDVYYFSSYNTADPSLEQQSANFLESIVRNVFNRRIICKVHTHSTTHAERFAQDLEDRIYVDREKYIFEGLYMQLANPSNKIFVSCVSTTALNARFMFGNEPFVIFTYRLYSDYRQNPIEGDDWLADILAESYDDKSRIMIPNSIHEYEAMLKRASRRALEE